jgi:polysaccharide export outer membrane protein
VNNLTAPPAPPVASVTTPPGAAPPPAGSTASETMPDYRLGSGDKVRILVYGEPTLSGDYAVSGSGKISFPLIGDVVAVDRTIREVQTDLEQKLANGYLRKPQVSAEMVTYRPYYMLGEVNRPGQYPYVSGLTVLQAVATAGGFTYRANNKRVYIRRGDQTDERESALTSATQVAPGDIVRIKERHF